MQLPHFLGGLSLVEKKGKKTLQYLKLSVLWECTEESGHLTQNGGIGKGFLETIPELGLKKVKDIPSMCQDMRT